MYLRPSILFETTKHLCSYIIGLSCGNSTMQKNMQILYRSRTSVLVHITDQKGVKCDLIDFKYGMVVGIIDWLVKIFQFYSDVGCKL